MLDIGEVSALLHIVEASSKHGDMFRNIQNSAITALRQIDKEHADAVRVPSGAPAAPQSPDDIPAEQVAGPVDAPDVDPSANQPIEEQQAQAQPEPLVSQPDSEIPESTKDTPSGLEETPPEQPVERRV